AIPSTPAAPSAAPAQATPPAAQPAPPSATPATPPAAAPQATAPSAPQADAVPAQSYKTDIEAFKTECTACHEMYFPQMLPARSWRSLMGNLDNHFGESAALDPKTAKMIEGLLVANAADSPNGGGRFMYGIAAADTPLRITDTPWWKRIHSWRVTPASLANHGIKSASQCSGCHQSASSGSFGDD
ncbi:MAG: hypothetical protein KGQ28_01900, partial [Hyphomicrobiales bacterium]|nr:hypothetical protein [Hyphomicrobiales bacterium]